MRSGKVVGGRIERGQGNAQVAESVRKYFAD